MHADVINSIYYYHDHVKQHVAKLQMGKEVIPYSGKFW